MTCFHRIAAALISLVILPMAAIKSLFIDKEPSFLMRLSSVFLTFFFIMPCLIIRVLFGAEGAMDKENFKNWLKSIYRFESIADEIIDKLALAQESWTPDELLHVGLSEYLPNNGELFFIDWKDSENFVHEMSKLAKFYYIEEVNWTQKNLEEDLPEALMKIAYTHFSKEGVLLYNTETNGDYYCLIAILANQQEAFEAASKEWGILVKEAHQPF